MSNGSAQFAALAKTVMAQCDELAAISSKQGRLDRYYLTPEHRECSNRLTEFMEAAGMVVWEDAVGNLWGRYAAKPTEGRSSRSLIMGSHHDSVPNAGRYDGPLGVLSAIAAVAYLHDLGERLPFHVDVVAFGDEEGARFGTTLLGSQPVAGHWKPEWWDLCDKEGVSLRQAFEQFGLNPSRIQECALDPRSLLGYLELHIEQGPVLEAGDHPLGVVTGIAGARRFEVRILGKAGHAGTVPMNMRRDALLGASEANLAVERIAKDMGVVATVGQIEARPGAVNVIPGEVTLSLDIRAMGDATRDAALERMRSSIGASCTKRGLEAKWEETHSAASVSCAPWLQKCQAEVLESMHLEPVHLPSGAGHDAMAMAQLTDTGMFFTRCADGLSHHPEESVLTEDVAYGIEAMARLLFKLTDLVNDENKVVVA